MANRFETNAVSRLHDAGKLAERKAVELGRRRGRPLVRFGPDDVDTEFNQTSTWPRHIRHAPDFLQFARFVEVQGCYDETVFFKCDKLDDLEGFWHLQMPVWFALYVQATDEIIYLDMAAVRWACFHPQTTVTVFDAGTKAEKYAYAVPLAVLLERVVVDAFDADRVQNKHKAKRTPNQAAA